MSYMIDNQKSGVDNMVALIHHTYPASVGHINATDYEYSVESTGDLGQGQNATVTITVLPSASLTGVKHLTYTRIDVTSDMETLSPGSDIDTYTSEYNHDEFERTEQVTPEEDGTIYTFTAIPSSLMYEGSFQVLVPNPEPTTLDEVLDGEDLNGFDDTSNY